MNLETPVEYFYGDTLRWSFGFENPNKAAVLFACALPLIWWCWMAAWNIKNLWLRGVALLAAAATFLVAGYCLCMTFSRGGLVAAGAGLLYLIGKESLGSKERPLAWARWLPNGLLLMALVVTVAWTGLGNRSAQVADGDASVGNRLELWSGALQMAVENPLGSGAGKSGEQYMQWYQAMERKEGYRTMVNSYLTFLVERGWILSTAVLFGFLVFWVWTKPMEGARFVTALRASILVFLIAGIFSTTMEAWQLWIFPIICGIMLLGMNAWKRRQLEWGSVITGGVCMLGFCAVMAAAGAWKMVNDPLRREFGMINGERTVVALGPKTESPAVLGCVVDQVVLGEQYSKLLRELALESAVKILLDDSAASADRVMWVGEAVHLCGAYHPKRLTLLAPEKIDEKEMAVFLANRIPIQLILPEIDEDGRVAFWDDVADGQHAPDFQKTTLAGVGNRIDWAWDQVVDLFGRHTLQRVRTE